MAKIIFKKHTDPSKKMEIINYDAKITDLHKYAKNKNKYFRISLILNILLLGVTLCLIIK